MRSLKSGKSWAVQTEETQPANNQFPVGRSNILFSDQASLGQIFALDQQKKILKPPWGSMCNSITAMYQLFDKIISIKVWCMW